VVFIDLRRMKEDIINRKVWTYSTIKNMIYDKELIIISPMGSDIFLNYEIE
jgi:hypothetical protein